MDYSILSNEINQPAYAGMADAEIADSLNRPGEPTRQRVPARDLIATAALNGVYAAIDAGAASDNAQVRGLCRSALVILSLTDQTVNLDDPRVRQMFGALQQTRVITADQAAQIDALANVPGKSRAQELGLGDVTEEDIRVARDWLAAQEAEQARLAAFTALRERLVNSQLDVLAWLQAQIDSGHDAPEWSDVLARM